MLSLTKLVNNGCQNIIHLFVKKLVIHTIFEDLSALQHCLVEGRCSRPIDSAFLATIWRRVTSLKNVMYFYYGIQVCFDKVKTQEFNWINFALRHSPLLSWSDHNAVSRVQVALTLMRWKCLNRLLLLSWIVCSRDR